MKFRFLLSIVMLCLTILLVPLINIVEAKSSDLVLNRLTQLIYQSCQGQDININQPYIINAQTNHSFNLLKWSDYSNYNNNNLKRVIEVLDTFSFPFISGTCENKGIVIGNGLGGCNILSCVGNKLDINGHDYFWNGVKVDVPTVELQNTYVNNSIHTTGPNSPALIGNGAINLNGNIINENNIIIQLFWSNGTIGGLIISFVIYVIMKLLRKKNKKKVISDTQPVNVDETKLNEMKVHTFKDVKLETIKDAVIDSKESKEKKDDLSKGVKLDHS
jgi:hypothetical protein